MVRFLHGKMQSATGLDSGHHSRYNWDPDLDGTVWFQSWFYGAMLEYKMFKSFYCVLTMELNERVRRRWRDALDHFMKVWREALCPAVGLHNYNNFNNCKNLVDVTQRNANAMNKC